MRFIHKILLLALFFGEIVFSQSKDAFQIVRLKYNGGSDWYNGQTEEVNLLKYISQHTNIKTYPEYKFVDLSTGNIFAYPFLFMTGHGNITFSDNDAKKLRTYLENGGFLYVDDDYGLDKAFRREIKKVFPDKELVELPFSYGLYHCLYDFNNGPPKIHEHDGKPAQGFGIFYNNRLVLYYTYESNPSDGWDDPDVHNDPPEKREEALKFGTNLVVWVLSN
ncbi:DUF4159 domain-containing protein [Melioribacteraceae bacterium 4301-Me]|uniref:DUF4159 domain-containing protein n=1 Tax=Pyranulibacter aquaticus TaxID=3163344 RepID=UPI003596B676